jgi:hypothetical protein
VSGLFGDGHRCNKRERLIWVRAAVTASLQSCGFLCLFNARDANEWSIAYGRVNCQKRVESFSCWQGKKVESCPILPMVVGVAFSQPYQGRLPCIDCARVCLQEDRTGLQEVNIEGFQATTYTPLSGHLRTALSATAFSKMRNGFWATLKNSKNHNDRRRTHV